MPTATKFLLTLLLLLLIFPGKAYAIDTPTLVLKSTTENSATFTWNKITGANEYRISFEEKQTPDQIKTVFIKDPDKTEETVGGLLPEKIYDMWMNACENDQDSSCSPPSAKVAVDLSQTTPGGTIQEVSTKNFGPAQYYSFGVSNFLFGSICQFTSFNGCTIQQADGKFYVYKGPPTGGAIGALTTGLAVLYTPPTSTSLYVANVINNFGIATPAFAQVPGSGSGIIQPIMQLWIVLRNLAFLIMTVVFLVVGFMIMFRQKLNAQTVISIQNALPGLVIGLFLIYISYFIAAVIADISFLGMQLMGQLFASIPNAFSSRELANESNILNLWKDAAFSRLLDNTTDSVGGIWRTVSGINLPTPGIPVSALILPVVVGAIIGTILLPGGLLFGIGGATVVGAALGSTAPLITGLLLPLILIIALTIQFIRLFFKLLNSYIMILVTALLGPMFILVGSVPGQTKALGFWWRNLLGHSLTFPAVFAVFLFAGMILQTPPETWRASPPLFGGLPIELLRLAIAYGIILGTPAVPEIVKKFVGAQDLGAIGTEGMRGFTSGFGLTRGAAMAAVNRQFGGVLNLRKTYTENRPLAEMGDPRASGTIEAIDTALETRQNLRRGIRGRLYDWAVRGGRRARMDPADRIRARQQRTGQP